MTAEATSMAGPAPDGEAAGRRPPAALAMAVAAVVCFAGLWVLPLQDPDEGRYAEIAREMAAGGELVTPTLNGIVYFEKPPLFFWLAAAAIRALGPTEAAARLPSALAALACAAVVYSFGARRLGPRTGALAALIFATAPLPALLSRMAIVDVVLCALVTGALAAAYAARRDDGSAGRAAAALFWLLSGLAVLCKGPIGLALPAAALVPYAALARDAALGRALIHEGGIAIFAATTAPWYMAMELRNPGYLSAFLLEQNVHRFVSGVHFRRDEPLWFYLAVVAGCFLPWTALLPAAARRVAAATREARGARAARGPLDEPDRVRIFLACAVLGPLVLLSAAHSKLVYYALPLFPPLALLAADAALGAPDQGGRPAPRPARGVAVAFSALGVLLLAAGAALALGPRQVREAALGLRPASAAGSNRAARYTERLDLAMAAAGPSAALLAGVGAAALAAGVIARRAGPGPASWPLGLALAAAAAAGPWVGARLGPAYSGRDLARIAARDLAPVDTVILFRRFLRTVPFYLDRTVVLWEARYAEFGRKPPRDDLLGHSLEKDETALQTLWSGRGRLVAVIPDELDLDELRRIVGAERVHVLATLGSGYVAENHRPGAGAR